MRPSLKQVALIAAIAVAMPMAFAQHGDEKQGKQDHAAGAASVERAIAVLVPTQGNEVHGIVHFEKVADGVKIEARVEGLEPNSKHGFHIHEFGDASSPDGTAMGGHFNADSEPHAGPDANQRHTGDFGNLEADENGVATYSRVDKHISFDGAKSVLGRGMIVHATADDLQTQPTGNAGARIAQGVIGVDGPDDKK